MYPPRPPLFLGKGLGRAHRAYDEKRGIWDQSRGDGAGVIGRPLSEAGVLTPMPHLGRCLPDPFKAGAERNLTVVATSPRASGIRRLLDGIHQAM